MVCPARLMSKKTTYSLVCVAIVAGLSAPVAASALVLAPPDEKKDQEGAPGDLDSIGARRIIMAPMNISIFDRGALKARANIELIIDVRKIEDAEETRLRVPQLRADFLSALSQLSRENFKVNRPLNPDLIKLYVTTYAERRLGKGKVDIYVKQAFVQPVESVSGG